MDEDFVGAELVAKMTGLSLASLSQLRSRGHGPVYYKPTPHIVRYRRSEVLAWLESNRYSNSSTRVQA